MNRRKIHWNRYKTLWIRYKIHWIHHKIHWIRYKINWTRRKIQFFHCTSQSIWPGIQSQQAHASPNLLPYPMEASCGRFNGLEV